MARMGYCRHDHYIGGIGELHNICWQCEQEDKEALENLQREKDNFKLGIKNTILELLRNDADFVYEMKSLLMD